MQPTSPENPDRTAVSAGSLVLPIMLFVLAGIPLVAYLWDTANKVFAGQFPVLKIAFGAVALIGLILLLRILAQVVSRWEGRAD